LFTFAVQSFRAMPRRKPNGSASLKLALARADNQRGSKAPPQEIRDTVPAWLWLVLAGIGGLFLGMATLLTDPVGRQQLDSNLRPIGAKLGLMRARLPVSGDYWQGCDDARAAGTAPIFRGEPGYREGMDGDGDGIACEPYY
jgi:hypothetical protein